MKSLAAVVVLLATGCNTDAPVAPQKPDAPDEETATSPLRVRVSVGARDGEPLDHFSSKDDVFLTAFADEPGGDLVPRDYFFRVVDSDGRDVSRSDAACRRVRIDHRGRIETLYANGDEPCLHLSSTDRTHGRGGVTVGLAPFGDANAILEGVASYEVQLAPVERFSGFQNPTYAAAFVLVMQVASN